MKTSTISGDAVRVATLTNAMLAAFEKSYNESYNPADPIQTIDILLAGHNVHKQLVVDCLARAHGSKRGKYELVASMRETWVRAMDDLLRKKADG